MGKSSESQVSIIDLSNWEFQPTWSQRDRILGKPRRPTLAFSTSIDLLRYLSDDDQGNETWIQGCIDARIKADSIARAWKRMRTYLKDLDHFPKYRKSEYDRYHAAAQAQSRGVATSQELHLASGLEAEIDASKIMVPPGQVLFHGRADHDLSDLRPYPRFVSTSLNPIVARQSGFRRSGKDQVNGRPVVYVLALDCPLRALWGQTGASVEYELLLAPMLTIDVTDQYIGSAFDVVDAKVVKRG